MDQVWDEAGNLFNGSIRTFFFWGGGGVGRHWSGKVYGTTWRVEILLKKANFCFTEYYWGVFINLVQEFRFLKQNLNPFCHLNNPECYKHTEVHIFEAKKCVEILFERPDLLGACGYTSPKQYTVELDLVKQHLNTFHSHTFFTAPTLSHPTNFFFDLLEYIYIKSHYSGPAY